MQTPLEVERFLFGIIQLAISIGGFTSLVRVFRGAGHELTARESAGMRLILEHVAATVCGALLPLLLFYSGLAVPLVWQLGSFGFSLFLLFQIVFQALRILALIRASDPPRHLKALLFHFFPGSCVCFIFSCGNVYWGSMAIYFWVLFWLLNPPCCQLYLSFFPPRAPAVKRPVAATPDEPPQPAPTTPTGGGGAGSL